MMNINDLSIEINILTYKNNILFNIYKISNTLDGVFKHFTSISLQMIEIYPSEMLCLENNLFLLLLSYKKSSIPLIVRLMHMTSRQMNIWVILKLKLFWC